VKSAAKRVAIEALGWILVVVGIAALVLPGPGLLALFAGVALLATQYEWAERRVDPVRKAALRTAADSVKSWPRILLSALGVAWLVGFGILWVVDPAAPSWWPVDDKWWLVGGWATGATLIGSGILAGAMIVYSFRNFRDVQGERPATSAALD
jgi:uncharacterized protein (TIGR02611 family)